MPDLRFGIVDVAPMTYTAVPTILARLRITNSDPGETIQSIVLNCQVQIQPLGRPYSAVEEARLLDLFGERERWGQTMKPLHWLNTVVKVGTFSGEIVVDFPLPCSLDFDVAANKYFYGLEAGAIQTNVMFSGTAFYTGAEGSLQIMQVPWDRESRMQIPVDVWKQAIAAHYGDALWLPLPRESFDRLYRYKTARGLLSWEAAIEQLLNHAERSEVSDELTAVSGAAR